MTSPLDLVDGAKVRSLYAAFDVFPSAKGAATHIFHFARALFDEVPPGLLYVVGEPTLPPFQREGPITVARFSRAIPGYLERAFAFGHDLQRFLVEQKPPLALAHFRDPFSGAAILEAGLPGVRTLFEVNGLPSIELPSRYPHLTERTLGKLRALEDDVLSRADRIVVPAAVTAEMLGRRGVAPGRVTIIPNGALPVPEGPAPSDIARPYVLYFGAVQPWQGVDVLVRAFDRVRDLDVDLLICSSTKEKTTRPLQRLVRRRGLDDRVHFRHRLAKAELGGALRGAVASVAPLTACERNIAQGCSPLKVLETLAAGVPLIASDLPAVREVCPPGGAGVHFVPPDRPDALARALRRVVDDPAPARAAAAQAQAWVLEHRTWDRARSDLVAVYRGQAEMEPR